MDNTTRSRASPHHGEPNETLPALPAPPAPVPAPAPKVFYEGCPGCAMERKVENNTGIPYKELSFVGVTSIASGTYVSMVHAEEKENSSTPSGPRYLSSYQKIHICRRCRFAYFMTIFWIGGSTLFCISASVDRVLNLAPL
jgi:hypothetical protein